ncbi:uncharacterized protein AKAME5_001940500 [Lates japonicus]|uniref:Uncharacterized protein n=1 Tax=Lates japonicus TaxID=270547 RepID=A0AAD3RH24_LATJO|nr:uncharacterized protein AKAME5_001940500 [Lates japonicus]
MRVLRSQSLRMKSFQDESSLTKTSSEKDESDFMCPDSGLRTRVCTGVKSTQSMGGALTNVDSTSLQLLISLNLRDQLRDQNQRVEEGSASTLDWD